MYTTIDLFAGAGGLSLGFAQTKKNDIKVAFENSPYMQETYKLNHPGVEVLGDVCSADYTAIQNKYGSIDVVIGGPPCQGFSNANRQKNHAISQNNMLVKQYIEVYRDGKICHGGMSRGTGRASIFRGGRVDQGMRSAAAEFNWDTPRDRMLLIQAAANKNVQK